MRQNEPTAKLDILPVAGWWCFVCYLFTTPVLFALHIASSETSVTSVVSSYKECIVHCKQSIIGGTNVCDRNRIFVPVMIQNLSVLINVFFKSFIKIYYFCDKKKTACWKVNNFGLRFCSPDACNLINFVVSAISCKHT